MVCLSLVLDNPYGLSERLAMFDDVKFEQLNKLFAQFERGLMTASELHQEIVLLMGETNG